MSSFYGSTSCMKKIHLHIIHFFHMHSWMLWTKMNFKSVRNNRRSWMRVKQMLKWSNNVRYCRPNTYCLLLTDLATLLWFCHKGTFSFYLSFSTLDTCANIKTCATLFFPLHNQKCALIDHSHTQTCTKVNKALKTRGIKKNCKILNLLFEIRYAWMNVYKQKPHSARGTIKQM